MVTGLRLLLGSLRAGRAATVGLVLLSIVDTTVRIAIPALIGETVNLAMTAGPGDALVVAVVVLLGVGVLVEGLTELTDYTARIRAMRQLRTRMLDHVFRFGYRGQRTFNQGDLVNRLTDATDQTAQAANLLTRVLVPLLTSIGGIIALFATDYLIGLTFAVAAPLCMLYTAGDVKQMMALNISAFSEQGELTTRLMDAIRGLRTIHASGTRELETDRVMRSASALRALSMRIWRQQRRITCKVAMLGPLLRVLVLGVAGYGVLAGRINAGQLLATSAYLVYAMGIFQQVSNAQEFGQLVAAAGRVGDVLDEPGLPSGPRPLPEGGGALAFHAVGAVAGDRQVLRDVTFSVPAGRTVALVGESGVGKTTLTALAGGLLAPDEGTVTFDGVPVGELRSDELRRAVVYAFERPNLLGETIADALRYGDPSITDAELQDALRSTGAEEFVSRLPEQAATPLSGLRLSGGEIQRLGLARAACRRARLIVMDDALSSVDIATEAAISVALQQALRGATRLLVAHRASTADRADFVVWLHGGTVAGIGTHRALLADPGYRSVFAVTENPVPSGG